MNRLPDIEAGRFQTPEEIRYDSAQATAVRIVYENGLGAFQKVIDRLAKLKYPLHVTRYLAIVIKELDATRKI